jgi:hypothetical protein
MLMTEHYRAGLFWNIMRRCPEKSKEDCQRALNGGWQWQEY